MNNLVDENYTEEEKQIIATPTPEQVFNKQFQFEN